MGNIDLELGLMEEEDFFGADGINPATGKCYNGWDSVNKMCIPKACPKVGWNPATKNCHPAHSTNGKCNNGWDSINKICIPKACPGVGWNPATKNCKKPAIEVIDDDISSGGSGSGSGGAGANSSGGGQQQRNESGGLGTGAMVGIAVGAVAVVVLIGYLAFKK